MELLVPLSFVLLLAAVVLLLVLLLRRPAASVTKQDLDALRQELTASVQALGENSRGTIQQFGQLMQSAQSQQLDHIRQTMTDQLSQLEQRLQRLELTNQQRLDATRRALDENMVGLRTENGKKLGEINTTVDQRLQAVQEAVRLQISQMETSQASQMEQFRTSTSAQMEQLRAATSGQMEQFRTATSAQIAQMEQRIHTLEKTNEDKLEAMRRALDENMVTLRTENSKKLDEIRGTVDEKLQTTLEKRIAESFRTVSEQLEQVYKGLGEMQNLASDVGGLKRVLSGVKTRGILGEIQLGAILEDILSPEQYDVNVATIPGSSERVEFAIRLPGQDGEVVYLPIDSKFPGERYAQLQDAQASGDKAAVEAAYKALEAVLSSEAKDIRTKYVEPPYTTNFGIMFLPFEGLYSEVVNRGLLEKLQKTYQVNIAGPSTMAALLNSLQMGFRTLAIQKRSNEVWQVLGAVKTEFEKFEDVLGKMQKHLNLASDDLTALMSTRTKAINRRLKSIQSLEEGESKRLLLMNDGSPD